MLRLGEGNYVEDVLLKQPAALRSREPEKLLVTEVFKQKRHINKFTLNPLI
jgi:hypothetical protein